MPGVVRAQQIAEDSLVDINCAGLIIKGRQTQELIAQGHANLREFNAQERATNADLIKIAGNVCSSRNVSELSAASQAKARKLIDIVNNDMEISRLSMLGCKFDQVLSANKASNAAMRLFVDLFAAPKAQAEKSAGFKRSNVNDIVDLSPLTKSLKIMSKYANVASNPETAADLQEWYASFQQRPGYTIIYTLAKGGTDALAQTYASEIRLMNSWTPNFTGYTTQEQQMFDFFENGLPKYMTNEIVNAF